jgi:hypothetical protein
MGEKFLISKKFGSEFLRESDRQNTSVAGRPAWGVYPPTRRAMAKIMRAHP